MVRLFVISFTHQDITRSAKVVEYHHSPSYFYVTFLHDPGTAKLPSIILQVKDGKIQLAKDSPRIDPSLQKVVAKEVEMCVKERPLA
jgi:hypothetical protein